MMPKHILVALFFLIIKCSFAHANNALIALNKSSNGYKQETINRTPVKKNKDSTDKDEAKKLLQLGACGMLSSLSFLNSPQDFAYYPEFSLRAYYQTNRYVQLVFEYSHIAQVNIAPTWLNVQNTYLDLDAHFLLRSDKKNQRAAFYAIIGGMAQLLHGIYTGADNDNKFAPHAQQNNYYKTMYYGGSIGVGGECRIIRRLYLFGEVRWRYIKSEAGLILSDKCYNVGIKYTLHNFKPIYSRPGKHFKWF
jgi:hypothetical protein